jgi:class III poly(R)-hydroxyalkanoic acid synthase PhaE subunit
MSDEKSMNDWMKDWDALQRQYFNAWSELARKAPLGAAPNAMPGNPFAGAPFAAAGGFAPFSAAPMSPPNWQEGFGQWTRQFADAGKQSETAERVIESAKSYLAMMQGLFGGSVPGGSAANPAQAWFDAARNGFGGANVPGIDPATNPFAKALRDIAGKGAQGFNELPQAFAPYVEQIRKEGMSWLQAPAFGLAREHQEHYQRTAVALVEYEQAAREYNRLMLEAGKRGYELFERKLSDHSEPGRTIDSLKGLYDLWVDAMEEAYAEIALSEEFSRAYGEMANAQMRLRKQIQTEVERMSREFGMPTRTELDSIGKRLHDLRNEVRDGAAGFDRRGIEEEIAALREEFDGLKRSLNTRAAARSPEAVRESAPPVAVVERDAPSAKKTRVVAKKAAARRPRRAAAAKPRVPVAVVRPRPAEETAAKVSSNSFADAVAAMQRRVAGKPKPRAVAAEMSKPSKGDKANRKGGKKK